MENNMTKQEFLKLFELEDIYQKYEKHIPFSFGYHDILTNTPNKIHFSFLSQDKIKLILDSTELSINPQRLEINLVLEVNEVYINKEKEFKNEIFPFLTFDTNFEAALKFIADFMNNILIPKYELKGNILVY